MEDIDEAVSPSILNDTEIDKLCDLSATDLKGEFQIIRNITEPCKGTLCPFVVKQMF
jgi:hypothetical protein